VFCDSVDEGYDFLEYDAVLIANLLPMNAAYSSDTLYQITTQPNALSRNYHMYRLL